MLREALVGAQANDHDMCQGHRVILEGGEATRTVDEDMMPWSVTSISHFSDVQIMKIVSAILTMFLWDARNVIV